MGRLLQWMTTIDNPHQRLSGITHLWYLPGTICGESLSQAPHHILKTFLLQRNVCTREGAVTLCHLMSPYVTL